MARVGQTTMTGGRLTNINDSGGPVRLVTLLAPFTANLIGFWGQETTAANDNDVKGLLFDSSTGATVVTTPELAGACSSVGSPIEIQVPFAVSATTYPPGTYGIALMAGNATTSTLQCVGSNGPGGTPVLWGLGATAWPTFPDPITPYLDSVAARSWDLYFDFTDAVTGTVNRLLLLGVG